MINIILKSKYSLIFLQLLFCFEIVFSQQENFDLTNWEIHTSFSDVRKFTKDNTGKIWCASNGGILIFDNEKPFNKIELISNNNGLISLDIRTIKYIEDKDLIVTGAHDGMLQFVNINTNEIEVFNDIKNYGFINPEITDLQIRNNLLYISCGFGMAIFDLEKKIFIETITKISIFNRNTKVNNMYLNGDFIYASTEDGFAYSSINNLLSNPNNWTNIPVILNNDNPIAISKYNAINSIKFENDIYVIVNDSIISKMDADKKDTLKSIFHYASYQKIKNFNIIDDKIYYLDNFNLREQTLGALFINIPEYINKLGILNDIIILEDKPQIKALLSFKEEGFAIYQYDSLSFVEIESPITSNYKASIIDAYGNLWLASAAYLTSQRVGKGISILKQNGKWLNLNLRNRSEITGNGFLHITPVDDGRVFAGNWGGGWYEFIPQGEDYKINKYDKNNSPFNGVNESDNYIVSGKSQVDKNGDIWTLNMLSNSGKNLLIKYDKEKRFTGYNYPGNFSSRTMVYLEIDEANTKWFANPEPDGLYYFNEQKNIYGVINTSTTNFLSNSISAMKFDNNNWLWLGSSMGLNIILNPTAVLNNNKLSIRKINFLNNVLINDIYIDAIDNKWISTNQGIYVLNADGSNLLKHFDNKNSPLKSNVVYSVTSNPHTGKIYITSDDLIYSASSLSVKANEEYNIVSYPQPFDPEKDNYLTIEGLVSDNIIMILTPEGRYIRRIDALGGRAIWDGKDHNGKIVNNGIYIIVANEKAAKQNAVGKIAVEKK